MPDNPTLDELWRRAFLIRAFEERLLALFSEGRLQGTVHTCSGQEWSALAVAAALRPGDAVFSNHRGHGHFLARRPDLLRPLLAEVMGAPEGLCGGVGGSQHLHADGFYSNGVQGGMTPIAAGVAMAKKLAGGDDVAVAFIGDGTTGEGVVYEAMNMAGIWRLPLLIALERNGYAQSTPTARTIAGDLGKRAEGFGFAFFKSDVWHIPELLATASRATAHARSGAGPALLEIECFRLNAHSKGDDNRPADLVAAFRDKDPINRRLRDEPEAAETERHAAEAAVEQALSEIAAAPCAYRPQPDTVRRAVVWRPAAPQPPGRHGEAVYRALDEFMRGRPEAILVGEDIEPPYGGAFKITRDLGERHPGRVFNTPIGEAGIVGLGTGLALAGRRPIVEIMFGDFLTLVFDQLQQHAAKFHDMYGGRVDVPLIVRTPSGGARRGYGPTHSQSLEKHFLGVPGLNVAALNTRIEPGIVLHELAERGQPALIIENKASYGQICPKPLPRGYEAWTSDETLPTLRLSPEGGGADVTVACYGGMLDQAEAALEEAFRTDEILCDVVCWTQLFPFNPDPLLESLARTGRLLVVEEGPGFAGWGSELIADAVQRGLRPEEVRRLAHSGVIPAATARARHLPAAADEIRRELAAMSREVR